MRTWSDIYTNWKSYEVKQIDVIDYNPELHDALPWFHKKKKSIVYLGDNAKNDTAKSLARGCVNSNDEIYAAFALYATLKEYPHSDKRRAKQLNEVVSNALSTLDGAALYYWHSKSKHVLPFVKSLNLLSTSNYYSNMRWDEYIRISSMIWKELAEEWVVLRFPDRWGIS